MNKIQLAKRRKEQTAVAVLCTLGFALIWAAGHYGWIEMINPFDGK